MLAEKTEAVPAPAGESKASFFRQSGWLLMAATASGLFMWAVHKFASKMPPGDSTGFLTLVSFLNMMVTPAMGLQNTFAQQTVSALSDAERRRLVGTVRGVITATLWLWLGLCAVIFVFRNQIVTDY